MKQTELLDEWTFKIHALKLLLEECEERMWKPGIVKEHELTYHARGQMTGSFNDAKIAIEFIKSRIFSYWP